jgi:hypothetical protein
MGKSHVLFWSLIQSKRDLAALPEPTCIKDANRINGFLKDGQLMQCAAVGRQTGRKQNSPGRCAVPPLAPLTYIGGHAWRIPVIDACPFADRRTYHNILQIRR